jgi:hypothetical protein
MWTRPNSDITEKERQFKFEVQQVLTIKKRILHEEFDSQEIFWVYHLLSQQQFGNLLF